MAEPSCPIARAWIRAGAPEEDAARVEAHAATCPTCARVVGADAESEERLAERVADLPKRIAPERELWPRIEARLASPRPAAVRRRRVAWIAVGAIAAAAAVVLVLRPKRANEELAAPSAARSPESAAPSTAPVASGAVAFDEEVAYARATDALRAELDARKPPAPMVAVVDDNVRIVDDAIRAVRSALAAHPDDLELRADLDRAYQDKLDLLRTATELPEGTER